MKTFKMLGVVIVVLFFFSSCGRREKEILVLCGESMRAALEEIIIDYQKTRPDKILVTYGGSGDLCAQIQKTGRGDLYICHDPFMEWAEKQGLISQWATVGILEVVIVVPKGNPKEIKELKDLAQPGLRLGIGHQVYSTSGHITKNILDKLEYGPAIMKNVRLETKGHQQRCADVATGSLDAAIVWQAVAKQFQEKLEIIPVPKKYIDTITSATYEQCDLRKIKVTVGIISPAAKKKKVQQFYKFIITEGKKVFEEYGFVTEEEK
jgi:molybdate transport system substrate-binding protein